MNNLFYYYLPTLPNNKLSHLLSIIDNIKLPENIIILTKKQQQNAELSEFLSTKGIVNISLNQENDFETKTNQDVHVYILSEDMLHLLKNISISYVISLFVSNSIETCKKKAAVCINQEKQILIELIGKFDFQFIQTLYKFPELNVQRFSLEESDVVLPNKNTRIENFITFIAKNPSFLIENKEQASVITTAISQLSTEEIKNLFIHFFALTTYTNLPLLENTFDGVKGNKEFKIIIQKGYLDNVNEIEFKEYLGKLENFKLEEVTYLQIEEKKTTLIIKSKELVKENIVEYFAKNQYKSDCKIDIDSITEKSIDEKADYSQSSARSSGYNRDRNDSRESGERGNSYNKSGGDYKSRDGGGRDHRSRDGGGRDYKSRDYQSRDRDYKKPYTKEEGSSTAGATTEGEGSNNRSFDSGKSFDRPRYGSRDSSSSRSGGGYRSRDGGSSSYGDRPRRFGSDNRGSFEGGGYKSNRSEGESSFPRRDDSSEGSGERRSSFGSRDRGSFGGGDRRSSGGSSYYNKGGSSNGGGSRYGSGGNSYGDNKGGGYQKRSFQRSNSGGGYNKFSKNNDFDSEGGEQSYKSKSNNDTSMNQDLE